MPIPGLPASYSGGTGSSSSSGGSSSSDSTDSSNDITDTNRGDLINDVRSQLQSNVTDTDIEESSSGADSNDIAVVENDSSEGSSTVIDPDTDSGSTGDLVGITDDGHADGSSTVTVTQQTSDGGTSSTTVDVAPSNTPYSGSGSGPQNAGPELPFNVPTGNVLGRLSGLLSSGLGKLAVVAVGIVVLVGGAATSGGSN